ncbi:hypothetical protein OIV83_002424 [Microbotryomycetes sp. JL201]|nr:hypothetical protein OIV83_002424 [Microbotryomycetes sp. JL201]
MPSGYSLWLSPSGDAGQALTSLLSRLSERHATPLFKPHTTLVADSLTPDVQLQELVSKTEQAVQEWKSKRAAGQRRPINGDGGTDSGRLTLSFHDVRQGDLFYQCVLAALVRDSDLVDLHQTIRRAYGTDSNPDAPVYFPHTSLVYGDLTREKKDQIIAELKRGGEVEDLPEATEDGSKVKIVGQTGYIADEILIVNTSGPTSEWDVLARIAL